MLSSFANYLAGKFEHDLSLCKWQILNKTFSFLTPESSKEAAHHHRRCRASEGCWRMINATRNRKERKKKKTKKCHSLLIQITEKAKQVSENSENKKVDSHQLRSNLGSFRFQLSVRKKKWVSVSSSTGITPAKFCTSTWGSKKKKNYTKSGGKGYCRAIFFPDNTTFSTSLHMKKKIWYRPNRLITRNKIIKLCRWYSTDTFTVHMKNT